MTTVTQRVNALNWPTLHAETDAAGCAQSEQILTAEECGQIADMYEEVERFRSTVDMARHRFGSGQYL
ncbi:proline hydroxylase, partial [Streptomyces sp. NPDC058171]